MGGKSTSHSAVLSSQKTLSSSSFDLHSWQGLTEVLRAGKESLRDVGAYAEFRNLVLEYAQRGGDIELRKKIDTIITSFSAPPTINAPQISIPVEVKVEVPELVRVTVAPPTEPKATAGIGSRRMQPRFESNAANVPEPRLNITQPEPESREKTKDVVSTTPSVPASYTPEPISPRAIEPKPAIEERPVVFLSIDQYKEKILQIKRAVNSHFGNPAMLVNMSNDLGKNYMTALLGALKATSAGSTVDVESAMLKLEQSSKTLLDALAADSAPKETPVSMQNERATEIKTQPEEIAEEVSVVEEEPVVSAEPILEEIETSVSDKGEPRFVFEKSDTAIASALEHTQSSSHSAASTLATLLMHDEVAAKKLQQVETTDTTAPASPNVQRVNEFIQSKHSIRGVAASHPDTIKDRSGVDSMHVAVQQSELVSPENTKALHNLLHEWNIFSGSGILGIGPNGSEHPLYIKLAPLSMGEVIAGRWEGGNPKTQRIIKEYVDAWRHEQGVAYNIKETFEHYLRRVVQRIMKRQNPGQS